MKFPYGIANFHTLITTQQIYLDRTHFIPVIEDLGRTLLFLRPRRFGKTLWLSTLENYYDLNKADQFETLFGHLQIGQNPTPDHNRYLILRWDFSNIAPQGQPQAIQQNLHDHLNAAVESFGLYYEGVLPQRPVISENAFVSLEKLIALTRKTGYKVYLLIDEYDNFANEVLMANQPNSRQNYENIVYSEGALKSLFKVVKSLMQVNLDRVFITGVSPVVMSDMTSGFNIAKDIHFEPALNSLCGFTENEVVELITATLTYCHLPPEQAVETLRMMRTFYDGYRFSEYTDQDFVYNPTLTFYFLDHLARHCQYPREILDHNMSMDRNKIAFIANLPHGDEVIDAILDESTPLETPKLIDRFGVSDMFTGEKSAQFMLSLLYYFGVITLDKETSSLGELVLRVPNLVTRRLYLERIQEALLPGFVAQNQAETHLRLFYRTGDIEPLCNFMVTRIFEVFDNRDYRWTNELTIKTAFMAVLFNDIFYMIDSETELNREYSDLILIVRPNMRQYALQDFILEFKYLSLQDLNLTAEALKQMEDGDLIDRSEAQALLGPAEAKLRRYAQKLQTQYGGILRLYARLVLALGYERILVFEIDIE